MFDIVRYSHILSDIVRYSHILSDIVRYSHILSDIVKYSLILFLILFHIFKCGQNELYQILLSNVRHYQIIYVNIKILFDIDR